MRSLFASSPLVLASLSILALGCSSSPADDAAQSGDAGTDASVDAGTDSDASDDGASPAKPPVPTDPSSPWPKFRGDAFQTGRSASQPKPGGAAWTFPTKKGIFSSPIVGGDGTVYVGSADRSFYAIARDGTQSWKVDTGEIIDSAGLLDDQGRVYFGSGDGKLRARDAKTGAEVWTFAADDPSVNKALINWFEGNVAIGADGTLYAGNDNFFLYAIDRDKGTTAWHLRMPDQTWSLPAVDPVGGNLYVGNNNLLPALGANTFAVDKSGTPLWQQRTLGTTAASPALAKDRFFVGAFDGYVRAFALDTGNPLWQTPTRDHVYASPAIAADGTVIQPSTDGTVYALDPASGAVKWTYDAFEPIRSSPAIGGDGTIYVGLGDGRLLALNADGTLRWAIQLITADRNDLNASPALGADAIYVAGESGEVFSVPFDRCVGGAAAADPRCAAGTRPTPSDGAFLRFTSGFGSVRTDAPSAIEANDALTFSLVVRDKGASTLAIIDSAKLAVTVTPPSDVTVDVSGDGKFLTIAPKTAFAPDASGNVKVDIAAPYLVDLKRTGLALSGGTPGGTATGSWTFQLNAAAASGPLPLPVPTAASGPQGVWELRRVALPLPTVLPSYNQIGFDSLHYLMGLVEQSGSHGIAWMIGAKRNEGSDVTVADPASGALIPLEVLWDGGRLTLTDESAVSLEIMNAVIPFRTFRVSARLAADGTSTAGARLTGTTICKDVQLYGSFLEQLGLCNPQTDVLAVSGAAELAPWTSSPATAPSGVGTPTFTIDANQAKATFVGSSIKPSEHLVSILLVDASTSKPVTASYGIDTKRTAAADGTLAEVSLALHGAAVPAQLRAYLMVDTYPAALLAGTAP